MQLNWSLIILNTRNKRNETVILLITLPKPLPDTQPIDTQPIVKENFTAFTYL